MTSPPSRPSVERADVFNETVTGTFSAERHPSGRPPSRSDFETLCWPALEVALSSSWSSAGTVDDEYPHVREILMRPVHGAFPPARIVFVTEPLHAQVPEKLIAIGIDFDWDYQWSDDIGD